MGIPPTGYAVETPRGLSMTAAVCWLIQLAAPLAVLVYGLRRWWYGPQPGFAVQLAVPVTILWIVSALLVPRTRLGRRLVERFARQLVLGVVFLVIGLTLAEAALRLLRYGSLSISPDVNVTSLREPHPTRGWALKPGASLYVQTMDYAHTVEVNAKGLQDVEREYEPAQGVFRIVVLGDSFMEAYSVLRHDSLTRQLEKVLAPRKVEVVNLGLGGFGTAQEYLYLLEEGLKYKPNLVLLAFYDGNDLCNNSAELERRLWGQESMYTFGRPYATTDPITGRMTFSLPDVERVKTYVAQQRREREKESRKGAFYKKLMLYRLARQAFEKHQPQKNKRADYDPNVWLGPYLGRFDSTSGGGDVSVAEYQRMWEEAWRVTFALIQETKRLAGEHGAEFALFLVPSAIQVEPSELGAMSKQYPKVVFDVDKPNRRMVAFCQENAVPVLDLAPEFRRATQANTASLFHLREDLHWNAAGHRLATQELVKFLDRRKLLPAAK